MRSFARVIGYLLFCVAATASPSMNIPIQEKLSYATVRIECQLANGTISCGTGFFFRCAVDADGSHIPVVVTNKHVVKDAVVGQFLMHLADENGNPLVGQSTPVALQQFESLWFKHPDPAVDLCILPIAPIINQAKQRNLKLFYVPLGPEILASDTALCDLSQLQRIVMIGYPIGLWDSANNMPIFRSGVAATHPRADYEGRQEFMIDAACFPGSSGSPVLVCDLGSYSTPQAINIGSRIMFLGVLYAGPVQDVNGKIQAVTIPTRTVPVSVSQIPINLGYVIKAKRLLEFDPILRAASQPRPGQP